MFDFNERLKMAEYKAYTIRLDPLVGDEYEKIANSLGLKPAEYFREILTSNLHLNTYKSIHYIPFVQVHNYHKHTKDFQS